VENTQAHPITLDLYLYVDPIGRVFTIDLLLAGSYLSFSDDQGQNWTTTALTIAGANDHRTSAPGLQCVLNGWVIASKTEGIAPPFMYLQLGIIRVSFSLENPTPKERKTPCLKNLH